VFGHGVGYTLGAPCCKQAKLLGALIIQSKQAVASLSTIMTRSQRVSATSYESTLVIAKSMVLLPGHPLPWLSLIRCLVLLCRINPLEENHFKSKL